VLARLSLWSPVGLSLRFLRIRSRVALYRAIFLILSPPWSSAGTARLDAARVDAFFWRTLQVYCLESTWWER